MSEALTIDIISDVVCPWCYVGKRRLERALAQRPFVKCEIRWLPYFLESRVPAIGMPRADYIAQKFGTYDKVAPGHARLVPIGAEIGIDFRFDRIAWQPNTLDAHRVIGWAQRNGKAGPVVERLFAMFFNEGANLSDRETLVAAGRLAGLDPDEMRRDLLSDRDKDLVEKQASAATRAGIGGVPFFVFGKKISVAGAHEVEVLVSAMDQAMGKEPTATSAA
jgi:predicted DsbA family dithiol-disulfide isomerase